MDQGGKGETPVLRSTGGVQAEYSGVQAEYVKYGGVLEYWSLAFSPLLWIHYEIFNYAQKH